MSDAMLAANVYVLRELDEVCERGDCDLTATHRVDVGLADVEGKILEVPLCRDHALAFVGHVLANGKPAEEWGS